MHFVREKEMFELAERFLSLESDTKQIFYIWGHSYEFDIADTWDKFESFCQLIPGHDDIFYGTNKEILVFFHFPPVWNDFVCKEIIDILKEYGISRVYFGHIHGTYSCPSIFEYEGIYFKMISADFIDFLPCIV